MTPAQLQQYDHFLDENDWDIYYWATQEPPPTSAETAEGAGPALATPAAQGLEYATGKKAGLAEPGRVQDEATSPSRNGKKLEPSKPAQGEWAQTVGTFKPAYRPVPARWRNSEILALLRQHVLENSAGGVHEEPVQPRVEGEGLNRSVKGTGGGGLGFMPELRPVV